MQLAYKQRIWRLKLETRANFLSLTLGGYYIQRRNVCQPPLYPSIGIEIHRQSNAVSPDATENDPRGLDLVLTEPGLVALLKEISLCLRDRVRNRQGRDIDRSSRERELTKTIRPMAYMVAMIKLAICMIINVSSRRETHQSPARKRKSDRATRASRSERSLKRNKLHVRYIHCQLVDMCICGSTDLPPLTLAVVLLEETLVVRDTVLAEHESAVTKRNCQPYCLSRRIPSIHAIPSAFVTSSVDRQESPVTSRPIPPTSGIVRGGRITGNFTGRRTQPYGGRCEAFLRFEDAKNQRLRKREGGQWQRKSHGEVVEGGSEGSCNWRVM